MLVEVERRLLLGGIHEGLAIQPVSSQVCVFYGLLLKPRRKKISLFSIGLERRGERMRFVGSHNWRSGDKVNKIGGNRLLFRTDGIGIFAPRFDLKMCAIGPEPLEKSECL